MARAWSEHRPILEKDDVIESPQGIATAILLGDARSSYPYLYKIAESTNGAIVSVSQQELIEARTMLQGLEGLNVCYSSAATVAAVKNEVAAGSIDKDSVVLVNLTGALRDSQRSESTRRSQH